MDARRDPASTTTDQDRAGEPLDETPPRLGLAELAEAAGVSVRTVRYYIAEGLLPPPEGAGPRSAYGAGHLNRLRLIGRLKDAYLPLREIRRRLDGLDDAAVRALLTRLGPPTAPATDRGRSPRPPAIPAAESPPDSAAEYLDRVMSPRPALRRFSAREPTIPPLAASAVGRRALPPELEDGGDPTALAPAPPDHRDAVDLDPALAVVPPAPDVPVDGDAWRRIRLGPDAELLIRDDAYRRRRDRIDWLVGWARKVFE